MHFVVVMEYYVNTTNIYVARVLFKQIQRLRYVQITNVWSRMPPKPGHELYKQLVELAFHVKKNRRQV